MMLCSELLFVASIIDGAATRHEQRLASTALQRIAESVRRMEECLDSIVGNAQAEVEAEIADSQSEEHLLAVTAKRRVWQERRSQIRLVSQ